MNLQDIEAFVAVAETGSVNRAAARLNLTQPATTRRIQNFEPRACVCSVYRLRSSRRRACRVTPITEASVYAFASVYRAGGNRAALRASDVRVAFRQALASGKAVRHHMRCVWHIDQMLLLSRKDSTMRGSGLSIVWAGIDDRWCCRIGGAVSRWAGRARARARGGRVRGARIVAGQLSAP